jgi:hypothetical protein
MVSSPFGQGLPEHRIDFTDTIQAQIVFRRRQKIAMNIGERERGYCFAAEIISGGPLGASRFVFLRPLLPETGKYGLV